MLSTQNCLYQVQEDRWITIKEEGRKEEDRQEEADLKRKEEKSLLLLCICLLAPKTIFCGKGLSLFPCISLQR